MNKLYTAQLQMGNGQSIVQVDLLDVRPTPEYVILYKASGEILMYQQNLVLTIHVSPQPEAEPSGE